MDKDATKQATEELLNMKQALLKFLLGPGKKILIVVIAGIATVYGVNLDFVQSILNSPTVARPAPVLVEADAGTK